MQLRVEQDALKQQLAEERRQHSVQVQEALRANEELQEHIRRIRGSVAGQASPILHQVSFYQINAKLSHHHLAKRDSFVGRVQVADASSPARTAKEHNAHSEVYRLEQSRMSLQRQHQAAEEVQRAASHQCTTRAEAGTHFSTECSICQI